MTNKEIIQEFTRGEKRYNAVNHIGYTDGRLWNYSTVLADLDRENKTATLNVRKYSVTTGRIQNMLRRELENAGYVINEIIGETCNYWNYGYQGAPNWKKSDFAPVR